MVGNFSEVLTVIRQFGEFRIDHQIKNLPTELTVFLLKIRHKNNNIALASPNFKRLLFNILSACTFYNRL